MGTTLDLPVFGPWEEALGLLADWLGPAVLGVLEEMDFFKGFGGSGRGCCGFFLGAFLERFSKNASKKATQKSKGESTCVLRWNQLDVFSVFI